MMSTVVLATFPKQSQAEVAVELLQRRSRLPQKAISIEKNRQAEGEAERIKVFLLLWTAMGCLAGGFIGFATFLPYGGVSMPFVSLMCALTGSATGGAMGLLVGGLADVISRDSLEVEGIQQGVVLRIESADISGDIESMLSGAGATTVSVQRPELYSNAA